MRTIYILGILVLLALFVPATSVHAGGVVTVCDEAHLLAALAGGGTVTFACSGTITLTNQITIAADTTIDANGRPVTISGNNAVRVFTVNSGVALNLDSLTIANGNAYDDGGGILNNGGTVTVSNATFSDNGASYVSGNLGGGGGIYNGYDSTLTVSNSSFSGNSSGSGALGGGGILNDGMLTVSNTTFSGNSAETYRGGGISNIYPGTVIVSNSTFSGNRADGDGAGIFNGGTMTVSNSAFSGNIANNAGGGICNNGALTIRNNTFSDNSATLGGGICNYYGTLTVSNSTFSGNSAYDGGGIVALQGTVTVSNTTFSGNNAEIGGGVDEVFGRVTFENTIVANSPLGGNCAGTVTDGGGNLSYPDATCPGINGDPMLGPLQNNGGPTGTMELGPGSAAFEAGNDATCAAAPVNNLDQRGVARPQGAHCDIGAVEHLLPFRKWFPAARAR